MATIPIEIILQDAEVPVDPTPTPESETNIVVPDTGTISNEKDSGGISSSVGIILPIVMAILAIVTVIVLMVRKHHNKHFPSVMNKKEKLATVASSTIAILAVTVLVGNLAIPATNAATSVEPGTADLETEAKITIVATREADNDSDTITATVKNTSYATANLDFGYKVTASMAEGLTNANLYLDGDETSGYYISPVTDRTLADNTWGYTLVEPSEESSYLSIPLSTKPTNIVKEIAKTAEDKPVDVYYTVQIDKDMPNGTYTGELEYTLSPAIEYMQDFSTLTPAEKTATLTYMPEGKQYILKDIRDKKPYYISRLADDNVWMTQNLDLDLKTDGSIVYNSTNTNLPTGTVWEPERATIAKGELSSDTWQSDSENPYSYDVGDVYYYTSGTTGNDTQYNSLADCVSANHTEAECQHYHAGNYYNWTAAIASNDSSGYTGTSYNNATTSICPAGWRLPVGPNTEDATYREMISAIKSYNSILGSLVSDHGSYYYPYLDGGFNAVRTTPLWLSRSGVVEYSSLRETTTTGDYWTSTEDGGGGGAYTTLFNSNRFSFSDQGRRNGYSLRCLAE